MTVIFLWVGILFVGVGAFIALSENRSRAGTVRVRGRIVGYAQGNGREEAALYAVVEFPGADGQTRFLESSVGSPVPLGFVGEEVPVLLRTGDAEHAVLGTKLNYVLSAIFAAFGCISLVVFACTFERDWISLVIAAVVSFVFFRGLQQQRQKPSWANWKNAGRLTKRAHTAAEKDKLQWVDAATLKNTLQKHEKHRKIAAPILIAAGIGLLGLANYFYRETKAFLETAKPAYGRVVDLKANHSAGKSTTYAPIVKFQVPEKNASIRFRHSFSASPPSFRVGDEVNVLYDPRNPQEAIIDFGHWNQFKAIIAGLSGALCLLLGFHSFRPRRKRAPDMQERFRSVGNF